MSKIISASPGVSSKTGKNDCTVRALANALGWSYIEAHAHMQAFAGRAAGTGCFQVQTFNAYCAAGAKKIVVYGRGGELSKKYIPEGSNVEFSVEKSIRLAHAIRDKLKTGKHIVSISGHALAVVDGKVIDMVDNAGTALVQDIFTF